MDRRQRHHPGDRPAQRPGPGPAQAHSHLLHSGAAVPSGAGVPAVPVRGGPRANRTGPAAQPIRDPGKKNRDNQNTVRTRGRVRKLSRVYVSM